MLELRCYRVKYKPSHPKTGVRGLFLFLNTDVMLNDWRVYAQ